MSTSSTAVFDAPIIGTDGTDFISLEDGISFQWVPAAGNAHIEDLSGPNWDTGDWYSTETTGPSLASGSVTFGAVTSTEGFQLTPTHVDFRFTDGNAVDFDWWQLLYNSAWSFDPLTGVLNPNYMRLSWDDTIQVGFGPDQTNLGMFHWSGWSSDTDYGRWQLVPVIHNVDVSGGDGDDTILGGQGRETLDGGAGNDVIRASAGNDLLLGGAGDDELHAGIGTQTLNGGDGNDSIWGGTGTQTLLGEDGRDVIHGGAGTQTLVGGAGSDTLGGGRGVQFLQGGNGSDTLHAGSGDETLSGGAGRDTFAFSTSATGSDVVTDFRVGQDIITIAADFSGLTVVQPRDLLPLISADAYGDAVLRVGSGFSLAFQHVAAHLVELHPSEFFRIS